MFLLFLAFLTVSASASKNASLKVNIPVSYEGKWGAWERQGKLSFDVNEKTQTLRIHAPQSTFKNFPGRTLSYALVKRDSGDLQMDIATFVCAGDQVLATETFTGTIAEARALQMIDRQFAGNSSRQKKDLARRLGRGSELPPGLQDYFEEHYEGSWSNLAKFDHLISKVTIDTTMRTPLENLSSSYHTRVLTKGACSPEFETVMAPLRFENISVINW